MTKNQLGRKPILAQQILRSIKVGQKRIEQGRIDRLLSDAAAFQQALTIRKYVAALRLMLPDGANSADDEFEQWSRWALAQADRIDPAIGRKFLNSVYD